MERPSMGPVLRMLCGENAVGEGPIEVMTRVVDFNMTTVKHPETGRPMEVPANTLVAFTADSFREVPGSDRDLWEFRTTQQTGAGVPARALLYLHGTDLFMVRALSKVMG